MGRGVIRILMFSLMSFFSNQTEIEQFERARWQAKIIVGRPSPAARESRKPMLFLFHYWGVTEM